MLSAVSLLLLSLAAAVAAPPSSPMSTPDIAPPDTIPNSKRVTTTFQCTGYYSSYDCAITLWLNDCKHSIKIAWTPLKIPGTLQWAKTHRNWCSVTYDGQDAIEEKKLEPARCDGLMRLVAAGLQGFPEVKWQDAKCETIGTPDGILYATQHWVYPVHPKLLHKVLDKTETDPSPKAIRLEDARSCVFRNDKQRVVHCPVLTQPVHSWLRKFLAYLDVHLVIANEEK